MIVMHTIMLISVESHKESVKTMSRIGPIKHEYDFGQDFRGYAAPMTKE